MSDDEAVSANELLTPDEWQARLDVTICDPDGWRHRDYLPWETPISESEFMHRAARSTQIFRPVVGVADQNTETQK